MTSLSWHDLLWNILSSFTGWWNSKPQKDEGVCPEFMRASLFRTLDNLEFSLTLYSTRVTNGRCIFPRTCLDPLVVLLLSPHFYTLLDIQAERLEFRRLSRCNCSSIVVTSYFTVKDRQLTMEAQKMLLQQLISFIRAILFVSVCVQTLWLTMMHDCAFCSFLCFPVLSCSFLCNNCTTVLHFYAANVSHARPDFNIRIFPFSFSQFEIHYTLHSPSNNRCLTQPD